MNGVLALADVILSRPQVLCALALGCLLMVPPALSTARGRGWSLARTTYGAVAAVGLSLVLATTLARYGPDLMLSLGRRVILDPGWPVTTAEGWLNVVLFVPVTFFGVLATRRVVPVVLGLAVLSPSIEYVQLVTGAGISQLSDVERNVAGVLMAAAVARIALAVGRSLTSGRDAATARATAPRVPGTAAREHAAR